MKISIHRTYNTIHRLIIQALPVIYTLYYLKDNIYKVNENN